MERFTSTQTHCGQYKRYGDFYRVWDIVTDAPAEETADWCLGTLTRKKELPPFAEWQANIRTGGAREGDASYYFRGYYTLTQTQTGYTFTICEPYCD